MKLRKILLGISSVLLVIFSVLLFVTFVRMTAFGPVHSQNDATLFDAYVSFGFILSILIHFPIMIYNLKKDKEGIFAEDAYDNH